MFAVYTTILSLATLILEESHEAPWYNRPGMEAWKFINLAIFVGLLYYFLRGPLREALRTRREGIRRELKRAQAEADAANAKLREVEARLSRLDTEVSDIRAHAEKEAEEERERIRLSAEQEAAKLRDQARREIESAGKAAQQQLREYAAEQSVRMAEEIIRRDISAEDDVRLIDMEVQELGGLKR
jgi:F-type H+-transporting ATPase subunit b